MKQTMKSLTWIILLFGVHLLAMSSDHKGLLPVNSDGFETGDWRNFRPHYAGDATDWIRPNFSMNQTDPINGNFSLQWQSDDKNHQWFMLSNAFYLEKPVTVAVDFRVSGDAQGYKAGLLLMESKETYAGIVVSGKSAELFKMGNATIGSDDAETNILPGTTYRLSVSILDDHIFRAEVSEKESGKVLTILESYSFIVPDAMSFYVETVAASNTNIDFDNLLVEAGDYLVEAGKYVRSPQFVVLPRFPDVGQEQGNWVGGHSAMFEDGEFKMWYRIRDNQVRGRGYGFAQSSDGLSWKKYENNPLFTHHPDFLSNEKICVLKVDDLYRAWYAVDAGSSWYICYATSQDGLSWEQHGLIIDESYCKDVVVIYLDGTYYLYSIKDNRKMGVYTSSDGVDFTHQNTIDIGVHAHVAAFYEKSTGLFHLYTTGGYNGVNHAVSANGIDFGFFTNVMNPSAVGLDDWPDSGVTYLSFITDAHGHVDDASSLPFYYQARNNYGNNIPDWRYNGGENVVLGGKYEGLFLGVPTVIHPDQTYFYEAFPFMVPKADGFSVAALRPIRIVVHGYEPDKELVASGSLKAPSTSPRSTGVQIKAERLVPGKKLDARHRLQ